MGLFNIAIYLFRLRPELTISNVVVKFLQAQGVCEMEIPPPVKGVLLALEEMSGTS